MTSFTSGSMDEMRVTKRNGELETIEFDKILKRIKSTGQEAGISINYTALVMKVIDQLYDKISTTKIDELTAEQCASMSSIHPDYNTLAGRIIVSNHHKNTGAVFSEIMTLLYNYLDKHGQPSPLIGEEFYEVVMANAEELNGWCDFSRDYLIDYFGFKTLERAYLMKTNGKIVERPQHMWLRVALGIHGSNLEKARETYNLMSQKYFTHATPTLFNAGTPHPQFSSCYLLSMESDSIDGIYNTLKDCANISKWAGGIGLHIHNIRASGSHIRGTNGSSNGIVPMLRVFNHTAKYVDQCVHPETIIYTTKGPIQIQHCVMGETEVINLLGKEEVIQNVLEHNYHGEALEIESTHSLTRMIITPEHPIYALVNPPKDVDFNVIKDSLDKKICEFEWTDAKELTTNDLLVYPIPSYEKDITTIKADDCYIYGIILGDGSDNSKTEASDYVYMHTTNKNHIAEFMAKYFSDTCTDYVVSTDNNATHIRWNQNLNLPFRYNDFYDENKEKRMQSRWMHLPIEKAKYILKGLLETDGCDNEELTFDSTSYQLIESVRYLCMRMGVLTSGYIRDRRENKNIVYRLRVPKTREICDLMNIEYNENQLFEFMRYDNFLLSRITEITPTTYSGQLYDLQMGKEHNYLLHNGLVHNGGGKRNGSFAIYLEPWHADIELFLQMRKNHGDEELKARDLFYALWIPDLFMERVKANGSWTLMCPDECPGLSDVYGDDFKTLYESYETAGRGRVTMKARDLWFQVLDAQMETGTPYLLYKDAVNKKSNQKNIGTIKSSNLCVAPETKILTDKGHLEIQSLVGSKVNVWNGTEFSEVEIFKTGTNKKLIEVVTSDGCVLSCTPYHKFFIQKRYNKEKFEVIEAQNLKLGDKLIKCDYPVIEGTEEMNYAYTHGFFCGDGTYFNNNHKKTIRCQYKCLQDHYFCKRHINYENENTIDLLQNNNSIDNIQCNALSYEKKPAIFLYADKKLLADHIQYIGRTEEKTRITLRLPLDIKEKYFVPMEHNIETKMNWFSGYCDADGCITNNQDNQQLQVTSINESFLTNVKLMLQTCGINPKVRKMYDHGTSYLPDGHGGYRDFETKPLFRMLITSVDLQKIVTLGFSPKRLKINNMNVPNRSASKYVTITDVIDNGRIDDTFCFTEPKRHAGIFNGIITSQCTEITEYSDDKESAVCNLASIALPTFLDYSVTPPVFDYGKLHEVTKVVTENLNCIIDRNYYPTEKTRRSNLRHRPIGIGVQGLADTFILMDLAFTSDKAKTVNRKIFETIYHGALERSCELAQREGVYETFPGSPASEGILQFDMWSYDPGNERYDWAAMKSQIRQHGLRNSLLVAPMPTASTSQILGFNECFEPITSNIYSRRTIAGEFVMTNKYLMRDLIGLGLWNDAIKNNVIANNGSIQHIDIIPEHIREKYRTAWEIPMKTVIDMAAERGVFICQSQSMNTWIEEPSYNSLTSMHFYSWGRGLKTGIYYLRRRAAHQAQQFTIEPEKRDRGGSEAEDENEVCEMCSG